MEEDYVEKLVRRYCSDCWYHAKQIEKLRVNHYPLGGDEICIDMCTTCPRCGGSGYMKMEIVSDHPSRAPMKNSQRCKHCDEVVCYKYRVGDEVTKCPKCGGEIVISTSFAIPDKSISDFTEDELLDYGIDTGPSFIAAPPTYMVDHAFNT